MSVMLYQLLELPCLKDATVVAGHEALTRPVTSVSVLEYAEPTALLAEFFEKNRFIGSEIALTCWYNIRSDVEAQCNIIEALANYGEVAVILYYLGIIVQELDPRVLDVANANGIALIVMPKGNISYRYSEVIAPVMEAIIKDRTEQSLFSGDLLNQITRLPEHLRTMDTLLSMLRDRLHTSFILTDQNNTLLNAVAYPMAAEPILVKALDTHRFPPEWKKTKQRITASKGPAMFLYVITTDGTVLSQEVLRQIEEVVQLFVNIWNPQHNQFISEEMIRTILRDEPIKMRRLGELFHIDVAALQEMWVLIPENKGFAEERYRNRFAEVLKENYNICICDTYEKQIVAFTDGACLGERDAIAQDLTELEGTVFSIQHTLTTTEVRLSYLTIQETKEACHSIFPDKRLYTAQDIAFAKDCLQCIEQGQLSIESKLHCLRPTRQDTESLRTLAVLLLDCQGSIAKTAHKLNLHTNSVKYRVQKLNTLFGSEITAFPLNSFLAFALGVRRILES
nr:PucR family transcriptional regulator [uncultured Sphaerochaeta sp.]